MNSYVIIRREYSYLEPLIRSLFEDAQDVTILIDRRSGDESETSGPPDDGERRAPVDRRSSSPMLDILINMQS